MTRATVVMALAAGMAWAAPGLSRPARACGGTFCDNGPNAMPVEQTGETILFVADGTHVEAHIQIQYDPQTEAEQFAWVVPVTALPEFSVGSQQLFTNILGSTVPSYGTNLWREQCEVPDDDYEDGLCDGGEAGGLGDGGTEGEKLDAAGGVDEDPEVVLSTTVGAFEVFVLDGGTAEGVMQWLGDNGFYQDEAATPILEEYLAEGHLFVAFRLAHDAESSEIHPIVLRYEGNEPCVPIRLTRIAAQDDLEIRAFFLAEDRFASSNWPEVTLNPLRLQWSAAGVGYREAVGMAIDEPGANGHGFVTEYAGPSDIVTRNGLLLDEWDPTPFLGVVKPWQAIQLLMDQQLVDVTGNQGPCGVGHPLVRGLVERYLPVPPELGFDLLCADPQQYAQEVDFTAWDAEAFVADFDARIVAPSVHAMELLDTWPVVTRLYTMLSPHEMTSDPMFHATPELGFVTQLTTLTTNNLFCNGDNSFSLPDGRLVAPDDSSLFPSQWSAEMPYAETVAYLPARGMPVVEVDNRDRIDALLVAWNQQRGEPRAPTSNATPLPCGDPWDGDSAGASGDGSGCGCRTDDERAPLAALLLGLGLLGLRRGRRRRG